MVQPHYTVKPNIGTSELADALKRVVPFVAKEDNRPVLTCVYLEAQGGKLTLVSADGFRMAICQLDYEGEGKALVSGADLRGLIPTLRKAQRVRLTFEGSKEKLDAQDLSIATERIAYFFPSLSGTYPDWQKLIPSEFSSIAFFDASDAIRAVATLKAQSTDKEGYPIDLAVSDGKIKLASPDGIGETTLTAETEGDTTTRIDGKYLAECLRACGGMVKVQITSGSTPSLFSANGYRMVVMPMLVSEKPAKEKPAEAEAEAKAEAKAEASQPKETKAKKEAVAVK
jgi:DNA polymerase-3 subunit beta